jgi:hypothetical protein
MAAVLFNFLGFGERQQQGVHNHGSRSRRVPNALGVTDEQRERFMRVMQKVVVSILFVGLLTAAIFTAIALFAGLGV